MAQKSLIQQILPLSLILASRFFGLFIVMPLLSLHALGMQETSPVLIGIAIGGYALTQVIFQVPFGFLSDKIGRKKIIALGLIVFALGSIICAMSGDNIYMLIFGRLLQGAGAIGGVVSAMIADLANEEKRTKAMAIMGATISLSFTAALILGPILGAKYGVDLLFYLTFILAILGIFVLLFFVPNTPKISYSFQASKTTYNHIFKNKNLQIMNLTNFLQKSLMTLAFLIIPIALVEGFNLPKENLSYVYIPAGILGFLAMAPAAIIAEKKGRFKSVLVVGILFFVIAYLLMLSPNVYVFCAGIVIFFIGFSVHEPIMQSLASRYCKAHQKGSALGIFTSFGYLGSFLGALLGGYLYEFFGFLSISVVVVIACFLWILTLKFLANPASQKNLYLPLKEDTKSENLEQIVEIYGIIEWYINENEKIAIIKYDKHLTSQEEILLFLQNNLSQYFHSLKLG